MKRFLSGLLFLIAGEIAGAETIRIGHVNSMTGPEATFGTLAQKGAAMAVQEVNAAGGIRGKRIELVAADDRGKSDEAVTAVTKLITQDKVIAIVGETASSRMLALAPIAQRYKVPVVSPSATNPKVTQVGEYIFRVCFIDPYQGKILAKFALDTLKAKRVAVLRDVRNDYSIGLADFFIAAFTAAGGQIISDQRYSGGDIDFRAQLTAVKTAAPDALFVPGYYTEVGLISRQARELGLKLPLVGGDGWSSPSLLEVGGKQMSNAFFADHFALEDTTPVVRDFIARFKKVYGADPNGSAALGYDAAKVILDAIRRAGSESPTAIRDALASTRNFPGATGKISIDAERNAAKPAVMLQVENGAIRFHSNVTL